MIHTYLIAYDIANDRRLCKVADIMKNYGVRVQKSVFEAALETTELNELKFALLQVLDPLEDGVKFFRLCERCVQRVNIIGAGEQPDLLKPLLLI